MTSPALLSATEAARAIREGRLTARELVEACLARIAEREPEVQAWTFLDPDTERASADARDAYQRAGRPLGPLHGVPVGLKDIIDTIWMPTENGTPLHKGRRPLGNARSVERLGAAGAIVLGKTVTTELAFFHPGKTRNPRDPRRTPGGSSSGSAAAVADGMVPLALGSQTNGSVIRPASYCGIIGYKPTHGLISRAGMLLQSRTLDHVGLFARTVEDIALLGDVLAGHDPLDPDTRAEDPPQLLAGLRKPMAEPALAFVRTPVWDQAEPSTRTLFEDLAASLGERCVERELPPEFAQAHAAHGTIMQADQALNYGPLYDQDSSQLSPVMRAAIETGRKVTAVEWHRAVALAATLRRLLLPLFADHAALLTPAAPGEAPLGLERTGNPAFCSIWSLLGLPAISLPLLQGPDGLPVGVQLVGAWGEDAKLLRTAAWLQRRVAGS
ncbi:MAG: amidase [Geminicoccaceae bacterium]